MSDNIMPRTKSKKQKKIYISGKMSGLPEAVYLKIFKDAEIKLANEGWETLNPSTIKVSNTLTYKDIMLHDIEMLSNCDAIYLLPNWKQSLGALAEAAFAEAVGLEVIEANK